MIDNHHVNGGDGDGAFHNRGLLDHRCHGCRERISLYGEPYCYRCEECKYVLHKRCAEAPLTIHHPLHQQHPLRLMEKPPYYINNIVRKEYVCEKTDCCERRNWKNFTYHCSTCKFDMDIICATATGAERKVFQHISHKEHPLLLNNLPQIKPKQDHAIDDGDSDGELGDGANDINRGLLDHDCKGCDERISLYEEPYCYRCDECDYDLHKLCAEAPLTIQHPLHQVHPLQLQTEESCYSTSCCQRPWGGFLYICFICSFKVDIICATAGERKVYNPHHDHYLSFHQRHSARCSACRIENKEDFFQCTTCLVFWLHKYCALLPKQLIDYYRHKHPLTIAYGLKDDHAQHHPVCRLCKTEIDRKLWIYSCKICRYFVHTRCAMKPRIYFDNLSSDSVEDGRLVRKLPLADEFHSLMEHLLLYYDLAYNDLVHDHPLILLEDHHQDHGKLSDDDKNIDEPRACSISSIPLHDPMKRINLLCNACVRPIGEFPFYRCGGTKQQCCKDFVLHKRCAELPNELPNYRLFHDQHPLMLLSNVPEVFGIFDCSICRKDSNGFGYGCVECRYYIDVRCAFMPEKIKHGAHPEHVLHLREIKEIEIEQEHPPCGGCRASYYDWMFGCDECKFTLCPKCAQLPKTMRHKYDKRPLELMYLPPKIISPSISATSARRRKK